MRRTVDEIKNEINKAGSPARAKASLWFFKTGKGDYGYGDVFVGVSVPKQRQIAKKYKDLSLREIKILLASKVHEYRLIALFILVNKYQNSNEETRTKIYKFYLANTNRVNNWDLVDSSAPYILGHYLREKNKKILYKLARSTNLWEKRIAIIATLGLIRDDQFKDTLEIAKILLNDKHDLIHKAVGWMLREVGKRSQKTEDVFLKKYYKVMPRTALRYAIERMPRQKRLFYLK